MSPQDKPTILATHTEQGWALRERVYNALTNYAGPNRESYWHSGPGDGPTLEQIMNALSFLWEPPTTP